MLTLVVVDDDEERESLRLSLSLSLAASTLPSLPLSLYYAFVCCFLLNLTCELVLFLCELGLGLRVLLRFVRLGRSCRRRTT